MIFGGLVFTLVLVIVASGYFITQYFYPQTTPLQTGWLKVNAIDNPAHELLDFQVHNANYRIPGRSFTLVLDIINHSDQDYRIGELATANVRFINPQVKKVQAADPHDLIAAQGLSVENNLIRAGEKVRVTLRAEDALWETQRLTSLVYDPDSFFAGLLFLYDDQGNRLYKEVGALMIPSFS